MIKRFPMDEIGWNGWNSPTDENFTNMDDKLMNQNDHCPYLDV
jgi:hypothetical protein